MIAKDINPFIRSGFILSKMPLSRNVICADCRLFYVINGSGTLYTKTSSRAFESDSLFLWKSGMEYRWEFSKSNIPQLAILNFDFNQAYRDITGHLELIFPESDNLDTLLRCEDFEDIDELNRVIYLNNARVFKKNVLEIVENTNSSAPLSKELAEASLKSLILKILRHIAKSTADTRLSPVLDYIHANFNREITNKELGEILNYHPHHVNLLMKKYTGTTLHSYITQYRMNEALKLLAGSDKSIEAVAVETGYRNPSHFHKIFKQTFGISPSEYRKSSILI